MLMMIRNLKNLLNFILLFICLFYFIGFFEVSSVFADSVKLKTLELCNVFRIYDDETLKLEKELANLLTKEQLEYFIKTRDTFFRRYCAKYYNYARMLNSYYVGNPDIPEADRITQINENLEEFFSEYREQYKELLRTFIRNV
jgi:hypothetical protein